MNWAIPLILFFLRRLVGSSKLTSALEDRDTADFVAAAVIEKFGASLAIGDGELLKKLWENREEILEFVLKIIGLFTGGEEPLAGIAALEKDDDLYYNDVLADEITAAFN